MNDPTLTLPRTDALSALAHQIAKDVGVYPMSVEGKSRTERQDGWNACLRETNQRIYEISEELKKLPDIVIEWLFTESVMLYKRYQEYRLAIICNDVFAWGCADAEDFELEDVAAIQTCLEQSPEFGFDLWVARKRKMKPQKPYYENLCEADKKLFDTCAP